MDAVQPLDDLRVLHSVPVRPVLVPADVLEDATNKAYDKAAQSAAAVLRCKSVVNIACFLLLASFARLFRRVHSNVGLLTAWCQ